MGHHMVQDTDKRIVEHWLGTLEEVLGGGDEEAVRALFSRDAHWRDLLAFTWDIGWVGDPSNIAGLLRRTTSQVSARGFRLADGKTPPVRIVRSGREVLEAFFAFDTSVGKGLGVVRLVAEDDGFRAWSLLTTLRELSGSESLFDVDRPAGIGLNREEAGSNWQSIRSSAHGFEDREPEVLIVGGGHSGQLMGARLGRLGVDALIVDRFPRVGDNWRTRYKALALHNQTEVVELPYMAYPSTFPEYLPKDRFANWLEAYADAMELNYWTSTEFLGGNYDESAECWNVQIRQKDGTCRTLRPKHLIVATGGVGGTPKFPDLAGISSFAGEAKHAKEYKSGEEYSGARVLVVGSGTSAHDIALDLHRHDAKVSLLQRSPTTVVSLDSANLAYSHFTDGTPTEEAHLLGAASFIYPIWQRAMQEYTRITVARDADLLARLERAGLRTDMGADDTGYLMKFYRYGGGYYIDVGCSEVIAAGDIQVLQTSNVAEIVHDGVMMQNGDLHHFDVIIFATGYRNQSTEVAQFFGKNVADTVGDIFGFDDEGEIRNAWKPTAQKGLWFMVGGIPQGRTYSSYLALSLKAALNGWHPLYKADS